MTLLQSIGSQIRALRKSVGLNQSGLANKLGVTREYISMIETGKQPISIEQLQKIAGLLGATVEVNLNTISAVERIGEATKFISEEFKKSLPTAEEWAQRMNIKSWGNPKK